MTTDRLRCVCLKITSLFVSDQLKAEPNEGKKTFGVTYVPQVIGSHKVSAAILSANLQRSIKCMWRHSNVFSPAVFGFLGDGVVRRAAHS